MEYVATYQVTVNVTIELPVEAEDGDAAAAIAQEMTPEASARCVALLERHNIVGEIEAVELSDVV